MPRPLWTWLKQKHRVQVSKIQVILGSFFDHGVIE